MPSIVVLVSGSGSNLQAIITAIVKQQLACEISLVIADRECLALTRAETAGIATCLLERKHYGANLSQQLAAIIPEETTLIVLAGFLSILSADFCCRWQNKIINLHPSLLPLHGGAGMWGMKVHQAVVNSGESESGCTVHYVDGGIDSGSIIAQRRLKLNAGETPQSLQERVSELEHPLLIEVIEQLITGTITNWNSY